MNHLLVRCRECDVVYVPTPPSSDDLAHAYHVAEYDSAEEADDAASAYVRALRPAISGLPSRMAALEIGAGTGAFLRQLRLTFSFETVVGVEPSKAAIAAAPAAQRAWIREGIFDGRDFTPESFDLICCFMTMEHVSDPGDLARSAYRLLRHGGVFAVVVHDYRSIVNRALGRRSPIIDIEHMQLFSQQSIKRLFRECGYRDISARAFANRYAIAYWLRLAPLPKALKSILSPFSAVRVSMNVGNTIALGTK